MSYPLEIPREIEATADNLLNVIQNAFADSNHRMGYRGQRKASWPLMPTLARFVDKLRLPAEGRPERKYTSIGTSLLNSFREGILVNKDLPPSEVNRIDLWQYGQHHGLPTPLLDWTWSPFVGVFFSLLTVSEGAEPPQREPRSLRALDTDLLRQINGMITNDIRPRLASRIQPESTLAIQIPEMEIVSDIDGYNRRLAYQQGFFTRHVFYKTFEIWAKRIAQELSHNNFDVPLLTKITFDITDDQRSHILRQLDQMNINSRVLFPDIRGSVDYACFRVEHQRRPSTLTFSATNRRS